MRRRLVLAVALLAGGLSLPVQGGPTQAAATFVVNGRSDLVDLAPGDGRCDVIPDGRAPGDQCTLRAAIQEANATEGSDVINFNLGSGIQTIAPASLLPIITDPVLIDGYSQPGTSPNSDGVGTNAVLTVELDGANTPRDPRFGGGLTIGGGGGGTTIRGLVINGFHAGGIQLLSAADNSGNVIVGNFIGTDVSGGGDIGNGGDGITVFGQSTNNRIGGSAPADRNLISGNDSHGIELQSSGNTVQGNLIGTDGGGTNPLGNDSDGIIVVASAGPVTPSNAVIGGNGAAANRIAFNGRAGVGIGPTSAGNRVLRNAIFANGGLGIDLGRDGPTANDPRDPDTGANTLQNKPQLMAAVTAGETTTVQGALNSTPNRTFVLRFFANPSGENEGRSFLGQWSVTINANGGVSFTFTPAQAVAVGQRITATATGPGGNTYEFSPPRTVTPPA